MEIQNINDLKALTATLPAELTTNVAAFYQTVTENPGADIDYQLAVNFARDIMTHLGTLLNDGTLENVAVFINSNYADGVGNIFMSKLPLEAEHWARLLAIVRDAGESQDIHTAASYASPIVLAYYLVTSNTTPGDRNDGQNGFSSFLQGFGYPVHSAVMEGIQAQLMEGLLRLMLEDDDSELAN